MLNENTAKMLISMKYDDKGIEGVINLIDEFDEKIKTISTNCEDEDWIKFIGALSAKFQLLDSLITTKKLQNQREDLKEIGNYLKDLGQELIDYKAKEETKKKSKIDEAVDNLFDILFGKDED